MDNVHRIDVMNPDCPSRRTLSLLSDKWVMLVIVALARSETLRNGQLKRMLGDVSQKMLTQTLRKLEASGLIARTIYDEVPPRVEYRLTGLGMTLLEPIRSMCEWAERYYAEVEMARSQAECAETNTAEELAS